jgi:hypothetical protein
MHSDGNGLFYIIHLDDLTSTSHDDIEAKVDIPAHGKLLWDEDPRELGNRGFATSTGESYLFEIDLAAKEQTAAYDYSSFVEMCTGLHAIAYSDVNNHVYAECTGGGGILEFDVNDGSIAFVHQFINVSGALYESSTGDMVVASNKEASDLYVFLPKERGVKSSLTYEVPMPGNPSTVSFYTRLSSSGEEEEMILCAPLTENLNQNQRWEDGTVACDAYNGCTGALTAEDVEHGICLHNHSGDDDATSYPLLRVTEVVTDMPACSRCADSANFNFEEGIRTGWGSCPPAVAHQPPALLVVLVCFIAVQPPGAGIWKAVVERPDDSGRVEDSAAVDAVVADTTALLPRRELDLERCWNSGRES